MKNSDFEDILEQHGIKPTANRIVVLGVLVENNIPLTINEMANRIETIDKSNIFRVLNLFHNKHLVHVIESGKDGVLYELCTSHHDGHDDDIHPHFYCEKCHQTTCLEAKAPSIDLPQGYTFN